MDRREERRDCPTSVVERYAENFHENFSAEMPIKYAPMKKFHLMKVARRRKSALKIFHTSAVRQKTKKAKGKSERREWGEGRDAHNEGFCQRRQQDMTRLRTVCRP